MFKCLKHQNQSYFSLSYRTKFIFRIQIARLRQFSNIRSILESSKWVCTHINCWGRWYIQNNLLKLYYEKEKSNRMLQYLLSYCQNRKYIMVLWTSGWQSQVLLDKSLYTYCEKRFYKDTIYIAAILIITVWELYTTI